MVMYGVNVGNAILRNSLERFSVGTANEILAYFCVLQIKKYLFMVNRLLCCSG